jgi:hypothetical protein
MSEGIEEKRASALLSGIMGIEAVSEHTLYNTS